MKGVLLLPTFRIACLYCKSAMILHDFATLFLNFSCVFFFSSNNRDISMNCCTSYNTEKTGKCQCLFVWEGPEKCDLTNGQRFLIDSSTYRNFRIRHCVWKDPSYIKTTWFQTFLFPRKILILFPISFCSLSNQYFIFHFYFFLTILYNY